ncbi:unnamed protein product [Microthlaspi erraticum]|uniref:25S rRNA (uridine-N(3))-methyltransferase BMT5-like domain-containing protein n=1 Tax=Microthlaspi erraticum TaxID=1685480 RepID=A0A6D2L6X1_9BRAS|nr:unnamed protein product [Microthlaspi erraticum]
MQRQYSNNQKILLVGEGDFSFSLSLARSFGSARNLTATSLDTREEVERKYMNGKASVEELERLGCNVVHGVNVHSMTNDFRLFGRYDRRIIYNFPHSGFGFRQEHEGYYITLHQALVKGFLKSAREMVKEEGGEIHVTHKTTHPYSEWKIETLAEDEGLFLMRQMEFNISKFPGYSNKKGSGNCCDASFPIGKSSTFMLKRNY